MSVITAGLPVALTGMDPRLAQNVRIRRGIEGPQLIVEFDAAKEVAPCS